jgi:hypothetical protein
MNQQQSDDVIVTVSAGFRQSRLTMTGWHRNVSAVIEQNFRGAPTATRRCEYERRHAQGSSHIDLGSVGEEEFCNFRGIRSRGSMEGGEATSGTLCLLCVDAGSMFNEESRDRHRVLLGRIVKQRLVVARTIVDVRAQ